MSDLLQYWNDAWVVALGDIDLAVARVGGRATKANPDKEDAKWWNTNGPEWLKDYTQWRAKNPAWKIWKTPDGEPAIELAINVKIADVEVKMIIDRVFDVDGTLVIVDLKTGSRQPTNPLQLGFYKVGLELKYGVTVNQGTYYMARQSSTGDLISLDAFDVPRISYMVDIFDKARQARLFLPNTNSCNTMCGFTENCQFYPGKIG